MKDYTAEEARERGEKLEARAIRIADAVTTELRAKHSEGVEDLEALSDHEALCVAYGMLYVWANTPPSFNPDRPGQTCGWCIKAAGNTQEAWDAAEKFEGRSSVEEHILACSNNPLVKRIAELTAELAEHYPVAISARAWAADELRQADLRDVIDKIGNGDLELRLAHLPKRLGGTYG